MAARTRARRCSPFRGRYQARGWTEWTQGFQFGSALLQFDATGDASFLELGRSRTVERMAPHLTHMGVHDHGFNNVSTYGNLWRLAREGRAPASDWELRFYELALKVSGAVQARRWTRLPDGGFIHSFNGAHSLFVDTIRSLRALALGFVLGQPLMEEQDEHVSLLERLVQHARATAAFNVYFGRGRDRFDVRGRVAHESLFNVANGTYRGPSTSRAIRRSAPGRAGWRGRCSALPSSSSSSRRCPDDACEACGGRASIDALLLEAARATCDHYLDIAAADGVPYWDAGAPGLAALDGWRDRPADPFNDHEPVDSSAAAIAAQGLLRLARVLERRGSAADADRYEQAGLRVLDTLFDEPYLSVDPRTSGAAAALGLSLAERLGLRAARRDHAARRIEPVGRLSRARSGAVREASRRGRAVSHLLRVGIMSKRLALVTGGTRGIGLGIARALAQDGWDLALCGVGPQQM